MNVLNKTDDYDTFTSSAQNLDDENDNNITLRL